MATLFRFQTKGISFDEMREHRSTHEMPEYEDNDYRLDGLACTNSVTALRSYIAPLYFGDMSGFEVVIFEGHIINTIYDGVVAEPAREIARVSVDHFCDDDEMLEYEN